VTDRRRDITPRPRIVAFRPHRPWARPGTVVTVDVELASQRPMVVDARVDLLDVERVVDSVEHRFRVRAGSSRRTIPIRLPDAPRHGYGLRLRLIWPGGSAVAGEAVEALDGWWQSPRHAAVTRFTGVPAAARDAGALRDWHVTVGQAYDWMWRHYRYRPPGGRRTFRDALGRRVSHDAVLTAVREAHRASVAVLAYGSVYGSEAEYVAAHPDERVFDTAGQPLSLGGTFFINDLRPGRPWRQRLLREYAGACRSFGFDGVHMDTYGPPHEAVAADGEPIRFADLYPGLIEEAAARLRRLDPDAHVLFNCVEGFPLERVAAAGASGTRAGSGIAALYLELWPPDDRFEDVVRWVERARAVANGRAVVIAAYARAMRHGPHGDERARAFESTLLLSSILGAAGAYHHTIAEGDRLLVEGYYPAAVPLRAREAASLRAAWRFGARYVHLLTDPDLRPAPTTELDLRDRDGRPIATSSRPTAGAVWVRRMRSPRLGDVLHLVDLRDQPDDRWATPSQPPARVDGWRLRWAAPGPPVAMSPWTAEGEASVLAQDPAGGPGTWLLPPFERWLVLRYHSLHE
jgi:dextranase